MASVVVVTGASHGVGRAVANAFARPGASVALLARGEESLRAATEDVERLGARALAIATDVADVRRATEVTYLGTVWGRMAALRRMRPRDRGTIVQVGSALAYRSIPLQSAYCGAKPPSGVRDAHGRFGHHAKQRSVQLELTQHRDAIATAVGAAAIALGLLARR